MAKKTFLTWFHHVIIYYMLFNARSDTASIWLHHVTSFLNVTRNLSPELRLHVTSYTRARFDPNG